MSLMYCKRGWALVERKGPLGRTDGSVCGRRGYSLDGRGRCRGASPGRPSDLPHGNNIGIGVLGHAESIGDGPETDRARQCRK